MRSGEQRQLAEGSPLMPQGHRRVAFLPFTHITLKSLIPKEWDFEPSTLGEHIYRRRIKSGLFQKDVAKLIGVTTYTITNWEKGHNQPEIRYMAKIIDFLGYNPIESNPKTIPEMLKARRLELGLSQKKAAQLLHVDESTWTRWEHGRRMGNPTQRERVFRFLGLSFKGSH